MLLAKFATICAATNSSLGIVNYFFDNLDLLAINPCLVPDGCRMPAYATAHVPSKLASPNTWIPIISKTSLLILIVLDIFIFLGSFFSHFSHFSRFSLVEFFPWNFRITSITIDDFSDYGGWRSYTKGVVYWCQFL